MNNKHIVLCFRETIHRQDRYINNFTLRFKDAKLELQYSYRRDATYKFYVICAFVIFIIMSIIQVMSLARYVHYGKYMTR